MRSRQIAKRTRGIAQLRKVIRDRQSIGFSLRAQADQMGISHHALRSFLNGKRRLRTRALTLWKIADVIHNGAWPPDVIVERVKTSVRRLRHLLTREDMDAVVALLEERIAFRRRQDRRLARAAKKASGGYYPFGPG